jgi:precorrin-6B methylase 2
MVNLCCVFASTPYPIVRKMLKLAEIKPRDLLCDVGSGDGRIPIEASRRYGIRSFGYETNEDLVRESKRKVRARGLEHLVRITRGDACDYDLSGMNIITLYLVPHGMRDLRGKLTTELKDGARIVAFYYGFEKVKPRIKSSSTSGSIFVYDTKSLRG